MLKQLGNLSAMLGGAAMSAVAAFSAPACASPENPVLQLDVQESAADASGLGQGLSESIITSSSSFTLGAMLTIGDSGFAADDRYQLVMMITHLDGSPVTVVPHNGEATLVVNGIAHDLSGFSVGHPFQSQDSAPVATLFKTLSFDFTAATPVRSYNAAEIDGGWTPDRDGETLLQAFAIDRSFLGNYLIQFDLVSVRDGFVNRFSSRPPRRENRLGERLEAAFASLRQLLLLSGQNGALPVG